jgi:D-alanyl-D-alanine carboxypeptidase
MCGQNGQKHNLFRRYMPIMVAAFLSFAAFVCSSCSETSSSLTIKQQVAWTLDKTMNAYNIPGAVVGSMVPGEEELVIRKGLADLETGSAIQTVDKFRIGSITKTFTATLILRLVDEGLLSLDDKLDEYVAGIPYANKITIRQLCNNTSGLANYGENKDLVASIEKEPHRVWAPSELVDIAISMGQHFPPGEGWYYSNTNFILLGMIIEKVTGNRLAVEIQQRITEPLGLSYTSLANSPDISGQYSHGYEFVGEDDKNLIDRTEYLDPSIVWGAGAMISNLKDLKIWANALAKGELLSEAAYKEQLTWVDISETHGIAEKYGLGIFYLGGLIGHDGRQPGYDTAMFYLPSRDAIFVVLLNKSEAANIALGVLMKIVKIVLPGEVPW